MAESHHSDRGPGVLIHNPHIRFMAWGPLTLKVVRPPSRLVIDQGLPNAPLTDNKMDRVAPTEPHPQALGDAVVDREPENKTTKPAIACGARISWCPRQDSNLRRQD